MKQIHPNLTPARREWLETLAREGVAIRSRGNVGYYCMRLGWTQWALKCPDGVIRGADELPRVPGRRVARDIVGEMLTDAGRAVLLSVGEAS